MAAAAHFPLIAGYKIAIARSPAAGYGGCWGFTQLIGHWLVFHRYFVYGASLGHGEGVETDSNWAWSNIFPAKVIYYSGSCFESPPAYANNQASAEQRTSHSMDLCLY